MGMKVGSHTMASAGKADPKRLWQSIRQMEKTTKGAHQTFSWLLFFRGILEEVDI